MRTKINTIFTLYFNTKRIEVFITYHREEEVCLGGLHAGADGDVSNVLVRDE